MDDLTEYLKRKGVLPIHRKIEKIIFDERL